MLDSCLDLSTTLDNVSLKKHLEILELQLLGMVTNPMFFLINNLNSSEKQFWQFLRT